MLQTFRAIPCTLRPEDLVFVKKPIKLYDLVSPTTTFNYKVEEMRDRIRGFHQLRASGVNVEAGLSALTDFELQAWFEHLVYDRPLTTGHLPVRIGRQLNIKYENITAVVVVMWVLDVLIKALLQNYFAPENTVRAAELHKLNGFLRYALHEQKELLETPPVPELITSSSTVKVDDVLYNILWVNESLLKPLTDQGVTTEAIEEHWYRNLTQPTLEDFK